MVPVMRHRGMTHTSRGEPGGAGRGFRRGAGRLARGSADGCRGGLGTEWEGTVDATFTIDEFRAGRITFLVPVTETDGTGTIEAIIVNISGR